MTQESSDKIVIETPRLIIYLAVPDDASFIHSLWTDPRVMRNVGFPGGLRRPPITFHQTVGQGGKIQ